MSWLRCSMSHPWSAWRVAGCSRVALLGAMTLALAVATPVSSHAGERPKAAELWRAYPLDPDAPMANDGNQGSPAAMVAGRDMAVPMGEESDGVIDSRLMLQLGMVIAVIYAAFLCVWCSATRGVLSFGAGLNVGGGPRSARAAWTAAVANTRPKTGHRFVAGAAGTSRADPEAVWTCEIRWRPSRVRSRFRAVMCPPDSGRSRVVAQSRSLRWPPRRGGTLPTAELESALDTLVASLMAAGWEPVESGVSWSARRFVWPRAGDPPAR